MVAWSWDSADLVGLLQVLPSYGLAMMPLMKKESTGPLSLGWENGNLSRRKMKTSWSFSRSSVSCSKLSSFDTAFLYTLIFRNSEFLDFISVHRCSHGPLQNERHRQGPPQPLQKRRRIPPQDHRQGGRVQERCKFDRFPWADPSARYPLRHSTSYGFPTDTRQLISVAIFRLFSSWAKSPLVRTTVRPSLSSTKIRMAHWSEPFTTPVRRNRASTRPLTTSTRLKAINWSRPQPSKEWHTRDTTTNVTEVVLAGIWLLLILRPSFSCFLIFWLLRIILANLLLAYSHCTLLKPISSNKHFIYVPEAAFRSLFIYSPKKSSNRTNPAFGPIKSAILMLDSIFSRRYWTSTLTYIYGATPSAAGTQEEN